MRFRYRAARFVLPRAALKCRVPVAGEAPAVVAAKEGRARAVRGEAVKAGRVRVVRGVAVCAA